MRTALLAAALAAHAPGSRTWQAPDTVRAPDRVRVTMSGGGGRITGELTEIRGDTLVLRTDAGTTERALLRAVVRVERSGGRPAAHGAWRGGRIGLVTGAAVLALGGAQGMEAGEVAAGVAVWATLGAVAGAVVRPEAWREVAPPEAAPAAAAAPAATVVEAPIAFRHTSTVLAPGNRIRFEIADRERVSGTVIVASRDSLLLDRGGIALRYALGDLRRVAVYRGKTARAGRVRAGTAGAVVGALLGGMTGFGLTNIGPDATDLRLAGAVLVFGAAGALTGYVMAAPAGIVFPADEWERVSLVPP